MLCKACGKEIVKSYGGLCQGCYHYFKNGGMVYETPPKGVIGRTKEGLMICHICGRAYRRLGSHVRESHEMTICQYKEKFGLCRNAKTTCPQYADIMSNYAFAHNMDKRILEFGKNTRIKVGDKTMRKDKEVRLQECLDKRNRYKK